MDEVARGFVWQSCQRFEETAPLQLVAAPAAFFIDFREALQREFDPRALAAGGYHGRHGQGYVHVSRVAARHLHWWANGLPGGAAISREEHCDVVWYRRLVPSELQGGEGKSLAKVDPPLGVLSFRLTPPVLGSILRDKPRQQAPTKKTARKSNDAI